LGTEITNALKTQLSIISEDLWRIKYPAAKGVFKKGLGACAL